MNTENIKTYYREWRGVKIRIEWEEVAFGWNGEDDDSDFKLSHVQVLAYLPDEPEVLTKFHRPALPITETGYKSMFQHPDTVNQWGGPVQFVMALLDEWAKDKKWIKKELEARQFKLF